MSTEAESADADNDTDEGWDIYPQVTQHPHTIIVGEEVADVRFGGTLDSGTENTGHNVGVVFKNPTVARGTLWQNREVPDGFDSAADFNAVARTATFDNYANGVEITDDAREEAQERIEEALDEEIDFDADDAYQNLRLAVDYKVADPDDRDFDRKSIEVDGEEHVSGISVGSDEFASEQADEFDEDYVMVWYRGISGQFIMSALDFNGRPSARFKEDGYLVKGLMQHPLGWFDRDTENYPDLVETTDRRKLASQNELGRPPRVARPPVLRDDIGGEEVFVEIDRYEGGRMLSSTVAYNDFDGDDYEDATVIEPRYEGAGDPPTPEDVLVETFDLDGEADISEVYELYHGDGWQPEPDGAFFGTGDGDEESGSSGGSFDAPSVSDDEVDHPTESEVEFGQMIAEVIAGTGVDPDEEGALTLNGEDMDLEGAVGTNASQFGVTPDVSAIRRVVYENTSHLDTDDLEGGDE